jgi:hypothetical protein
MERSGRARYRKHSDKDELPMRFYLLILALGAANGMSALNQVIRQFEAILELLCLHLRQSILRERSGEIKASMSVITNT